MAKQTKVKKDSFFWHIRKILADQKKPMHYADITREILKVKETKGKTPERTVMAVILRDTHNTFMRIGDGVFGLTRLAGQYKQNEAQKC